MSAYGFFNDYSDQSDYSAPEKFNDLLASIGKLSEEAFNVKMEQIKTQYHITVITRLGQIKHSLSPIIEKEELSPVEESLSAALKKLFTLSNAEGLPTLIRELSAENQATLLSHVEKLQQWKQKTQAEARAKNAEHDVQTLLSTDFGCDPSLFQELSTLWDRENGTIFAKAKALLDYYLGENEDDDEDGFCLARFFNSYTRHHCGDVAQLKTCCNNGTIGTVEELVLSLEKIGPRNPEGHLQAIISIIVEKLGEEQQENMGRRNSRHSFSFN